MIRVQCGSCSAAFKAKDEHAGRRLKCPRCGGVITVPELVLEELAEVSKTGEAAAASVTPAGVGTTTPSPSEIPNRSLAQERDQRSVVAGTPGSRMKDMVSQYSKPELIIFAIAAVGLLILSLSPLSNWITFAGAAGVSGISGDGKYVLGLSILAIVAFAAAVCTRKRLTIATLSIGAWGTVAFFWMASVVWNIRSLGGSPGAKDNPLAAVFASMISPGVGLYIGISGGLVTAAALGYLAVLQLRPLRRLWLLGVVQVLALLIGLLAGGTMRVDKAAPKAPVANSDGFVLPKPVRAPKQGVLTTAIEAAKADKADDARIMPAEVTWTDSAGVAKQGDIAVKIDRVATGVVKLKSLMGRDGESTNEHLVIYLTLSNKSNAKKIEYQSWAGATMSFKRDFVSLHDEHDNTYKRIDFSGMSKPVGQIGSESIYPGASVSDVLVFERIIPAAAFLFLEMPAENFGGTGMIRFKIPTSTIGLNR